MQGRFGSSTDVVLEVVAYDPLRRLGFMRAAGASFTGRVHFALAMLPEPVKRPIILRSKPLNDRSLDGDVFRALMRELRRDLVGRRFHARMRRDPDARVRLVRRSITALGH